MGWVIVSWFHERTNPYQTSIAIVIIVLQLKRSNLDYQREMEFEVVVKLCSEIFITNPFQRLRCQCYSSLSIIMSNFVFVLIWRTKSFNVNMATCSITISVGIELIRHITFNDSIASSSFPLNQKNNYTIYSPYILLYCKYLFRTLSSDQRK